MSKSGLLYPFDSQRCIGTISELGPSFAKVNLPNAALADGQWHYGNRLGAGEVGEFVIVECGDIGIVGRIVGVKLPENERLAVELELGRNREAHPIGTIHLLTTLDLSDLKIVSGVRQYPRLGSKVYAAHPTLLRAIAESTGNQHGVSATLHLGHISNAPDHMVEFSPESLFGRHCAVLGATGGGKSWTVSRLIEQSAKHNSKSILLDATGEFHTLDCNVSHCHLSAIAEEGTEVVIPYRQLGENDLMALFRPSPQVQAPKLRAAMKSLKVAMKVATIATNGVVKKSGKSRLPFDTAWQSHLAFVEGPSANFDIHKLCEQVNEECIQPNYNDASKWGNPAAFDQGVCITMMSRITDIVYSEEMACIFRPEGKASLFDVIEAFLLAADQRVLRISLKHVPFAYNMREIVANAIGKQLLRIARNGSCKNQPLIVFLDEAHQFLDRVVGDENSRITLDAFDQIAKEGRKYCLNLCIATQRPRDVPEGVLSQMGSMIVHRLINERDREIVEKASGEIDRSAAAFLPTLEPGQAVIVGVDFPMPLTIMVEPPFHRPDSKGADFQTCWNAVPSPAAVPV